MILGSLNKKQAVCQISEGRKNAMESENSGIAVRDSYAHSDSSETDTGEIPYNLRVTGSTKSYELSHRVLRR